MHRPFSFRFRRAVVWLLACVLPLQAMAAAMVAATGPMHTHVVASTRLVLDDLRRSPAPSMGSLPREVHLQTAFGHFHARSDPQRHHHAAGDASVVLDPGSLLNGDGDDASASPLLTLLLGLVALPTAWRAAVAVGPPATHAAWSPQTHDPAFPERPPRAG